MNSRHPLRPAEKQNGRSLSQVSESSTYESVSVRPFESTFRPIFVTRMTEMTRNELSGLASLGFPTQRHRWHRASRHELGQRAEKDRQPHGAPGEPTCGGKANEAHGSPHRSRRANGGRARPRRRRTGGQQMRRRDKGRRTRRCTSDVRGTACKRANERERRRRTRRRRTDGLGAGERANADERAGAGRRRAAAQAG